MTITPSVIADLVLHGWRPARSTLGWRIGIYNDDLDIGFAVWDANAGTVARGVGFTVTQEVTHLRSVDLGAPDTTWDDLPTEALQRILERLEET